MKTKNILLSAGRMTAKIADVGLARYMAQTHMDTKSLPMGTFVYAAPELLLGRRSDHKASSCMLTARGCHCHHLRAAQAHCDLTCLARPAAHALAVTLIMAH